jgi:hypothetical protein
MKQSKVPSVFTLLLFCLIVPLLLLAEDGGKNDDSPKDLFQSQTNSTLGKPNPYAAADISIKVIPSVNKTYGYDILVRGKPLVHQPNIPGLPGNEGFATEERAKTVAELVVKKIKNNEMPPTVSIEELNGIGVLK